MDQHELVAMIQGASVLACVAIALYFLRSWNRTRDVFFLLFSLAFATMAVNRWALAMAGEERDESLFLYLVRLAAFLLIAIAIVLKNRQRE
jgi:hypothetical protein